jgi:hypothetical protein
MSQYTGTVERKQAVIETIKKAQFFKSGEEFTVSTIVSALSITTLKCEAPVIRHYLNELRLDNVVCTSERQNLTYYKRARSEVRWERIPWRKHTNEKMGCVPTMLGAL